jgi:hypothetical protein
MSLKCWHTVLWSDLRHCSVKLFDPHSHWKCGISRFPLCFSCPDGNSDPGQYSNLSTVRRYISTAVYDLALICGRSPAVLHYEVTVFGLVLWGKIISILDLHGIIEYFQVTAVLVVFTGKQWGWNESTRGPSRWKFDSDYEDDTDKKLISLWADFAVEC